MKKNTISVYLLMLSTTLVLTAEINAVYGQEKSNQIPLNDLTAFNDPGKSWAIVEDVNGNINVANSLTGVTGTGVLLNLPSKKVKGTDLYTVLEYGDVDIELKFLMSKNGNSGIYLQGRYEVQLEDSWNLTKSTSASNGGIYNLKAPRINASKAPGLWQDLKISFQAPRFNSSGEKIQNARFLKVLLNGVVVQENVELFTPTPGAVSNQEVAKAALRIQGDHGAIAFKDLVISEIKEKKVDENEGYAADPILVEANENTILRSFMDLDQGVRVVHAVSVGSANNVHYTYDMDHGMLVQAWRGQFLDATPMWDGRGNGTSLPMGAIQYFGQPALEVVKLANQQEAWPVDTVNSHYKPDGYVVDSGGIPTFVYKVSDSEVRDKLSVLDDGSGINREITVENGNNMYMRLAKSTQILEIKKGHYLIGDKEYYLQLHDPKAQVILRDVNGEKELIAPIKDHITYSISF
ncbi:3-keto-disaccharide hydrolase [Albibacterium bauzanense]|uniref:Uncharacterized protein DUF1080 n=1 Tax=Albibacterium bauzanense TaxID=653929 RepID=A0A4R1M3H8_9SPHI|nr:DUF1080 domain-containing protein [Albibacterium bauzanense]TCK85414.1 uncharacterized protein DUF1080 [Albibacterium bauzanense]